MNVKIYNPPDDSDFRNAVKEVENMIEHYNRSRLPDSDEYLRYQTIAAPPAQLPDDPIPFMYVSTEQVDATLAYRDFPYGIEVRYELPYFDLPDHLEKVHNLIECARRRGTSLICKKINDQPCVAGVAAHLPLVLLMPDVLHATMHICAAVGHDLQASAELPLGYYPDDIPNFYDLSATAFEFDGFDRPEEDIDEPDDIDLPADGTNDDIPF